MQRDAMQTWDMRRGVKLFKYTCLAANIVVDWVSGHTPEVELHPLESGCLRDVRGADRDTVIFAGSAAHRHVENDVHVSDGDREAVTCRLSRVGFQVVDRLGERRVPNGAGIVNRQQYDPDRRLRGTFVFFGIRTWCEKLRQSTRRERSRVSEQPRGELADHVLAETSRFDDRLASE